MTRVKRSVNAKKKRRKTLELTKGFRGEAADVLEERVVVGGDHGVVDEGQTGKRKGAVLERSGAL